jgi:VanZ family protein
MIFSFSLQNAVNSSALSDDALSIIQKLFPFIPYNLFVIFLLRKAAHFIEYFILGLLTAKSEFKPIFYIMFLVPFIDEGLQFFAKGRGPSLVDALWDMCALSLSLYLFIAFRAKKKKP